MLTWQNVQLSFTDVIVASTIVPLVTLDGCESCSAVVFAEWQPERLQLPAGVVAPFVWQMPQPVSVRPATVEWILATSVPPVWQVPPVVQDAALAMVCEVFAPACMGAVEDAVWQPPSLHEPVHFGTVARAVGWHTAHLEPPPCAACNSVVRWHTVQLSFADVIVASTIVPLVTLDGWLS
jgi:hypothetical protein